MDFPILFQLVSNKAASVADCGTWEDGTWCWQWDWTRNPLPNETVMAQDLGASLYGVQPTLSAADKWF